MSNPAPPFWLPKLFAKYYNQLIVNGQAQVPRGTLDLEPGTGVTLTPTDNSSANTTTVTVTATASGISYPLVNPSVVGQTDWYMSNPAPAAHVDVYTQVFAGSTISSAFTAVQIGPNLPQPNKAAVSGIPTPPTTGLMVVKYRLEVVRVSSAVGAIFEGEWAFATDGTTYASMGTSPTQSIATGTNSGAVPSGWIATLQVTSGQVQLVLTTDNVGTCIAKALLEWSYTN